MDLYPKTDFPGLADTAWERLSMAFFESQAKWRHVSIFNAIIFTAFSILFAPDPPLIISLFTLVAYISVTMGFMSHAILQIIRRLGLTRKLQGEQGGDANPTPS